jgi:hypothetical protein
MTKENLLRHIEAMQPDQIEFLGDLLNFANSYDYRIKFKLCGITEEQDRKIDTATPSDYNKAITEIYPDFINGHNVYNYNVNKYGEMMNINNLFVNNLKKVLKLKTL